MIDIDLAAGLKPTGRTHDFAGTDRLYELAVQVDSKWACVIGKSSSRSGLGFRPLGVGLIRPVGQHVDRKLCFCLEFAQQICGGTTNAIRAAAERPAGGHLNCCGLCSN